MSYSLIADIESEFKDIVFTTTSVMKIVEVESYISQHDALIDSYLASRYETPITGTNALLIMKMLSIALTKSRVIDILEIRGVPAKNSQTKKTMTFEEVEKYLTKIQKGEVKLVDATEVSSSGGIGVSSGSTDCCEVFNSCRQQW